MCSDSFEISSIELSIEKSATKKMSEILRIFSFAGKVSHNNVHAGTYVRCFARVFFIYYKRCITKINCTQYFFSTYRHVFSINAPYVNEKPISRSQTRAVHV